MLTFDFTWPRDRGLRVLCVGAHSDDIEIGCGGTILRLLSEHRGTEVYWVVLGSSGERDEEAVASAEQFLKYASRKDVVVEHFKNSFFPYVGEEIKVADLKAALDRQKVPEETITPGDAVFVRTGHGSRWYTETATFYDGAPGIGLEYEILKYDGDLGSPNVFVHLDEAVCEKKISVIMECFKSQQDKDWFTPDAFLSLLRIRGVESRAPGRYAEAFYCRKVVL